MERLMKMTLAEVMEAGTMLGEDVMYMLAELLQFDGESLDLAERIRHGVAERVDQRFQIP